jgi:hypothetical protein
MSAICSTAPIVHLLSLVTSANAAVISKTVWVYDYTPSTNIIIFVFIPELQVPKISAFLLVDPVLNKADVLVFIQILTLPDQWNWCL